MHVKVLCACEVAARLEQHPGEVVDAEQAARFGAEAGVQPGDQSLGEFESSGLKGSGRDLLDRICALLRFGIVEVVPAFEARADLGDELELATVRQLAQRSQPLKQRARGRRLHALQVEHSAGGCGSSHSAEGQCLSSVMIKTIRYSGCNTDYA